MGKWMYKLVECHMYYHVNPNKEEIAKYERSKLSQKLANVFDDTYVLLKNKGGNSL